MKKIIILLGVLFCMTGCTEYTELENLAYVSAIGIDYDNDKYTMTYEILNNKKEKDTIKEGSYTISGEGKTLTEATQNTSAKISKKPFFDHTQVVIVNDKLLENGLEPLTDFVLRNTQIRNSFYLYGAKNAEEILKSTDEINPVVANRLKNLIEINTFADKLDQKTNYDEFINNIENYKMDNTIPELEIIDNNINIKEINLLNKYKKVALLSTEDANLISFLTRSNSNIYLTKDYNDLPINLKAILTSKKITITSDSITLDLKSLALVVDNEPEMDLLNEENYQKLNTDYSEIMREKIIYIFKIMQKNNSDLLGIKDLYYKKNREELGDIWTKYNINVNVKLSINKKGIIYDTTKNN